LSRNDFSAAEGRGHARAYLFEAGLHWLTWQSQARFRIDTGAGAGLLWLPLRADAATGYLAKSDHLSAAVFFVNAALSVKLSPTLAIRTAVLGGLTAPRPRVQFGTREVAAWGRSFATAALGLELGFW